MAAIVIPSRQVVQPQAIAPVVPLFGRPPACFVWNKPFGYRNLISGKAANSVVGTPSALGGLYGPVLGIKGTGSKVVEWLNPSAFCTTSDGAGTGDFTFAAIADPANVATKMALVSQDQSGSGQAYIIANCDTAYGAAAGTVMFQAADGGGTSGVSAASQTDGKVHFWVGTRVAGVMSLYRDGVQVASSSLAVRNILTVPAPIGVAIGGLFGFAGYESTATHAFSAMFNYGMTALEVAAWARNPWQIFKAPTRRLYFDAEAAGATPNITSVSTATPREGASLTITGTAFGASQGAGNSTINGEGQTETSWADTQVVSTVVLGTLKFGAPYNVALTDNAGTPSNNYAGITGLLPANSELSFVDIVTPNPTADYRLTAVADIASGDQIEYDNVGGLVTVYDDATFAAGPGVTSFSFRVWTPGSGYGDYAVQNTVDGGTGVSKRRYAGLSFPQRLQRSVSYYDP